jgi:hypothetical protein
MPLCSLYPSSSECRGNVRNLMPSQRIDWLRFALRRNENQHRIVMNRISVLQTIQVLPGQPAQPHPTIPRHRGSYYAAFTKQGAGSGPGPKAQWQTPPKA